MNKKLILSIFVLAGAPVLLSAAGEARLLRFPATNGKEIVFSYAGDLYKVPAAGGEAQRLTSHVGYEMFPRFSPDGKTIHSPDSMMEIQKCIPCLRQGVNRYELPIRLPIAAMTWVTVWDPITLS